MADIVDFAEKKFFRDNRKRIYGDHDVRIDWSDVTVYSDGPEPKPTDRITMGPATQAQVAKLFQDFGLPETPQTYGELASNHSYVRLLIALQFTLNMENPQEGLEIALETARQANPAWVERVHAMAEGDIEKLARLHKIADVFRLNGLYLDDKIAHMH